MKIAAHSGLARFSSVVVALSLLTGARADQTLNTPPAIVDGSGTPVDGGGGKINGNGGSGHFVESGSLTISNATLTNFHTTGGAGSGGGAGLGGAIFVNTGATVTLNNVNFDSNTAEGGAGGVGSKGGTLNNRFNGGSSGTAGANGTTPNQTIYTDIGGTTGTKGYRGLDNSSGFGGAGGNGGAGGSGGDRSPSLILGVTTATLGLADLLTEEAADDASPFTLNVGAGLLGKIANAVISEADAITALADFDKSLSDGQIGLGGAGATGGNGGTGGTFFGGGAGGDGGNGGTGGSNWGGSAFKGGAAGGDAGSGGTGGLGGFGAGGGVGGDGGIGGAGAGGASYAGSAAVAEVTVQQHIVASYKKGYYFPTNSTDPADFVVIQDGMSDPITPYTDNTLVSGQMVTVQSILIPAHDITIVTQAARDAIPAGSSSSKPNGLDGTGGAGGNGGFGGGTGASGYTPGGSVAGGNGGNAYGGAIFVRSGGTLIIQGDALFENDQLIQGRGQTGASGSVVQGISGITVGSDLYMMTGSSVVLDPGAGHVIQFNGNPYGTSIADDSAASMIPAGGTSSIPSGQGEGITIASGLVIFNGGNTYSGTTEIAGGVLQADDTVGIYFDSHINFSGGVLQSNGGMTLFNRHLGTASTGVSWTGDGGFAAQGADLVVNLNNQSTPSTVTWDEDSFVPTGHSLIFGSATADSKVIFKNNIDLNEGNRTILVTANDAVEQTGDAPAIEANIDTAIITGHITNGSLTLGDVLHTGTLVLTNSNSYADGTTIVAGDLVLANSYYNDGTTLLSSGSLNANGAVTVNTGAGFDFSQVGDQSIGSLAGGGTVSMGDNTLTINQSTNTEFSGVLQDGGIVDDATGASLIKQGSGTLTLSGDNTYTGTTAIKAGTLTLTGSLVSNDVSISAGATLNNENGGLASDTALTNAGTLTQDHNDTVASLVNSGTINGTATLTAATYALNSGSVINANLGAGALTANGTVALNGTSAAGTVEIASGTTTLGSAERLLDTTALTIDSGATLTLGGNEKIGSFDGAGSLKNAGGKLTVDSGEFSGVVSGTGGLTKVSSDGTLTLSGANTYSGTTQIDAGTLTLTGSLTSPVVNVASGAALNNEASGLAANTALTNDGTINQNSDDTVASLVNTGTINNSAHTLTAATYALNEGSEINANLGTGIVTANGTVALNGTSAAATVDIVTGTTTLGSAERLLDASTVTVSADAKLILGGDEKITTLDGAGEVSVQSGTLIVSDGTFSGVISGTDTTHGLTKVTAGTLTLSGENTYTGTTQINGGTLTLTGSLASLIVNVASGTVLNDEASGLASGAALTNDGTVNLNSDDTVASLVNTGTINNDAHTLTAATYALNEGSEINANLGTGIVTANGTVALNGTSAAATVNIETGTTTLGSAERLLDTTAVTISADATLILGGAEKIGVLDGAGDLQNAGGKLTVDSGEFSGVVSGTGGLTKVSSEGTLTLSGENTYSGTTQIDAGTLTLDGSLTGLTVNVAADATLNDTAGGLAAGTVATVDGTLALTASDTIDTLNGSGSVTLADAKVLTTTQGNFTGVLSGAGGLTVTGDALTLTGANTYTGGTTINNDGVLALGSGGSLAATGAVTVNGTFDITQSSAQTIGDLSGSGVVALGDNDLTLGTAGDSTYSGTIQNDGIVSGTAGNLVKQGSGTFTLTGTSSVPTITVNAGTLALGGSSPNLATPTEVTVSSGAELAVNNDNTITTLNSNGAISGSKTLTATTYNLGDGTHVTGKLGNVSDVGGSTVYVNGAVTFDGTVAANTIYVQTGLLNLASADVLSHDATVDIASVATLSLTGGDQTINTLTGAGTLVLNGYHLYVTEGGTFDGDTTNAGGLTKTGSGTLTLTGDNTFSDGTAVNEGTLTVGSGGTLDTSSTNVDGGTLQVDSGGTLTTTDTTVSNGTLVNNGTVTNNVVITSTGTLSGNGTIAGDVTGAAGSTTSPGSSPGVLHVLGNFTENGILAIELADASGPSTDNILGYDQVAVGGNTVINPATSVLTIGHPTYTLTEMATLTYIANAGAIAAFDPAKGDTFTIINGAPGTITGHFATFTNNFTHDVIFDVSTGQLVGTGLLTGSTGNDILNALPGASSNLKAMIASLQVGDHQYVGGDFLAQLLAPGLTPEQIAVVSNKASPEAYAGFADYADRATRNYADTAVHETPLVEAGRYALFAGYAHLDAGSESSVNQADYDLKSDGIVAGARVAFTERFTAGLYAAFDSGSVDSTYLNSDVDGQAYGIFGEYTAGAERRLTITGTLSTGTYKADGTRETASSTSSFHGVDSTATLAALAVRYDAWKNQTFSIQPELRLTYVDSKVDGFTETNANAYQALAVHSQDNTSFTGEAAVNAVAHVTRQFSLNARLGVSYDFDDTNRDVTANVATETTPFTVTAPGMGETAFNIGAGASYDLTEHWSVGATYRASFSSDAKTANSFYLSTGYGF